MTYSHRLTAKSKAALIMFAAVLMVYLATRLFMSSLYSHQAILFLEDWHSKQVLPSEQAWSVAKQAMLKAEAWAPVQDAFLQEKLGKVYEWHSYSEAFGSELVHKDRMTALNSYRKQAQLTPLWPNAWLNIMAIKIQLNEYDVEFSKAMIKAEEATKGHPKGVYRLAEIGIQAWPNLSSPQKSKILKMIGLSVTQKKSNAVTLKPLLDQRGLLPMVCYYLKVSNIKSYKLCY
ncbi:MAG: polysaccharide biosynthesis protein VpsP [Thiomicrorhabdus sp.]|nr:MAG: polysaccharide biosynthesis protein VpsP [Thiomicrorhabdus sp.]